MSDSIKEEDIFFENGIFLEENYLYFESNLYKLDALSSVNYKLVNVEKEYVGRSKFPLMKFFITFAVFILINNFFENGINTSFQEVFYDLGLSKEIIKNMVDFAIYYKSIFFILLIFLIYSMASMIIKNLFSKENYSYDDEMYVIEFSFYGGKVLMFSGEEDLLMKALPAIRRFLVENQKNKKYILLHRTY